MNMSQFLDFLEPNETRGGAICKSSADEIKIKIALEKACVALEDACTPEAKKAIEQVAALVNKLSKPVAKQPGGGWGVAVPYSD